MKALNEATKQFAPNQKNNPNDISNNFSIDSLDTLKRNIQSLPELEPTPNSYFSRIANFWGNRSWWLKALILFTLTLPIIITAVYLQIPLLFFAAAAVAGIYIGVSLLLDTRYNIEEKLQNSFSEKTNALLQFIDGKLNSIWGLGRSSYVELGSAATQNQQLTKQVESLSLENTQFKTQITSLEEKLLNLSEVNTRLERTNHQLQQCIGEITSNNNDKFLHTLIAHINANQNQYAVNQNYFGMHQNQVNPNFPHSNAHRTPYIQKNFFEPTNEANTNLDDSFRITYPNKK